jgi:superfamily II RNA helicase
MKFTRDRSKTPRTRPPRRPRSHPRHPASSVTKDHSDRCLRVHHRLSQVFSQIGTPPDTPFVPDPFQIEALHTLATSDVLVSAPTGAGKTWVALQAIYECLRMGQRLWYASPLKALSNSKYEEFKQEFGPEKVGILTGDRKENPDAQVIVGTTEILRNQLYDAMYQLSDIGIDLAVLDEAHYLSDPERGVVWEEVLIYLPHRVKLLLLSATLENASEIAQWLSEIRGTLCSVVSSTQRPVPLVPLFLFPHGEIAPLSDRRGLLNPIKQFLSESTPRRQRGAYRTPDFGSIIEHLRFHNLLPAILFLKSRADCDNALTACAPLPPHSLRRQEEFAAELEETLAAFPFLAHHRQLSPLRHSRVAAHHAGQLPQWKLLIEKMMNTGMMDAIFSTSTVAAGVNFPARTVVIVQSDRFNGKEFVDLTATELHQMTGRAGRRGKDNIGFAVVVPGAFQNPFLIDILLSSRPEPIKSQIQINFSMVLNLLLSHRSLDIRNLLDRSFATFQHRGEYSKSEHKWRALAEKFADSVSLHTCTLTDTESFLDAIASSPEPGTSPGCEACPHFPLCQAPEYNRVKAAFHRLRKLAKKISRTRHRLWFDFLHHLAFLKQTGFVDSDELLTPDGMWAAQLRVDQPLLIAECVRQRVFETLPPPLLAGLLASFVSDKVKEVEVDLRRIPQAKTLTVHFLAMINTLEHLRTLEAEQGFHTPPLQLWPAAALFLWASGYSWPELLGFVEIEEGDMAMLILRTADHLRQVANLDKSHPALAERARQALPLIVREPVSLYG